MTSRTANFCIDAHDPRAQVAWWAQVLDDFEPDDEGADDEGADDEGADDEGANDEAGLRGPAGRWLLFLRVPEAKQLKNRMHMCLRPVDRSRDEEVARLLDLGATIVNDLRTPDSGWAVLADPEGNEFCVLTRQADESGVTRT